LLKTPHFELKRLASLATFSSQQQITIFGTSCRALYHCNYCQKDISNVARIKCAICPDFDLCLQCFSVGVEITPHKNDHDYRVVDNLSFPILHLEWGVSLASPACIWYLLASAQITLIVRM
jgi:hypothetical protein